MRLRLFVLPCGCATVTPSHRSYITNAIAQRSVRPTTTRPQTIVGADSSRLVEHADSKPWPSDVHHEGEQRDARDNKGTGRLAHLPRGMASSSISSLRKAAGRLVPSPRAPAHHTIIESDIPTMTDEKANKSDRTSWTIVRLPRSASHSCGHKNLAECLRIR
jgi:hypothetical protein